MIHYVAHMKQALQAAVAGGAAPPLAPLALWKLVSRSTWGALWWRSEQEWARWEAAAPFPLPASSSPVLPAPASAVPSSCRSEPHGP